VERVLARSLQDGTEHAGGGGLAVGSGDHDGTVGELRGEGTKHARIDYLCDEAGEGRASAPAQKSSCERGSLTRVYGRKEDRVSHACLAIDIVEVVVKRLVLDPADGEEDAATGGAHDEVFAGASKPQHVSGDGYVAP